MSILEENNLIQRCRMGESAAFGELMKIYRRRLFSYLFKLCGRQEMAEDIFQETMIKVWRALPKYSDQSKFSSWLFSIAHNSAMDLLRKKKKEDFFVNTDNADQYQNSDDPHQNAIYNETMEIISNAVEKLTLKQRDVFLLRINGGLSFKDIAEITGEPINTVLSHMQYSVKKLRKVVRF